MIIILTRGSENCDDCRIERRYSDFLALHRLLMRECPGLAKGLSLPPKLLFQNYKQKMIQRRREALQEYLNQIVSNVSLRRTRQFVDFCCGKEKKEAVEFARQKLYAKSLEVFLKVLSIQSKLLGDLHAETALTHCHVTAIYTALPGNVAKTIHHGEKALEAMRKHTGSLYYVPLLRCLIKAYRASEKNDPAEALQRQLLSLTTSAREKSLLQLTCDSYS